MTVYANLVDGNVAGVYDLIPETWNSIKEFNGQSESVWKENGFVRIIRDKTPFDSTTHTMSDFPWYEVKDGQVIEHRDIIEISQST